MHRHKGLSTLCRELVGKPSGGSRASSPFLFLERQNKEAQRHISGVAPMQQKRSRAQLDVTHLRLKEIGNEPIEFGKLCDTNLKSAVSYTPSDASAKIRMTKRKRNLQHSF